MDVNLKNKKLYSEENGLKIYFADVESKIVNKEGNAMILQNQLGVEYPLIADDEQLKDIRDSINCYLDNNGGEKNTVVAVSGGFDPLHSGHIEMFKKAAELGDELVVIVNKDKFLKNKKGYIFMELSERKEIVRNIECVDKVITAIDSDQTVKQSLSILKPDIFAQGGDRNVKNIPEYQTCQRYGIEIVDGLGEKIQSSSKLVREAAENLFSIHLDGLIVVPGALKKEAKDNE